MQPIRVTFQVGGIAEVQRAFKTVQDSSIRAETTMVRTTKTSEKAKSDARYQALKQQIADQKAAIAELDKWQNRALKDRQKAEKEQTDFLNKEEKKRTADAKKEADNRRRRQEQAEKEERDRARRVREQWAAAMGFGAWAGARRGMSVAANVTGRAVNSTLALGGGFSVEKAVQDRINLERNAVLLSNKSYIPGQTERVSPQQIIQKSRNTGLATGFDATEIQSALSKYVELTGNYQGAQENIDFFAQIAKGQGANVVDVAQTAANLQIANKELGPKAANGPALLRKMLIDAVMQGREGAIDFPELAKAGSLITKSSSAFVDNTQAQKDLMGVAQITRRGTGQNVREAATSLTALSSSVGKHSAIYDPSLFEKGTGRITSVEDMIEAIFRKSRGNLNTMMASTKSGGLQIEQRGMTTMRQLAPIYHDAIKAAMKDNPNLNEKQKEDIGIKAIRKEMDTYTKTKYTEEEIQQDAIKVLNTTAEQFEKEVRKLNDAVGSELIPELVKLVPIIRDITPYFANFLKFLVEHPGVSIGGMIASFMVRDLAAAAIGVKVTQALSGELGGAIQKSSNMIGGVAAAAIGGVLAAITVVDIVDAMVKNQNKKDTAATTSASNATGKAKAKLARGEKLTEQDMAELNMASSSLDASIGKLKGRQGINWEDYAMVTAGVFGGRGRETAEAAKENAAQNKIKLEMEEKEKKELAALITKAHRDGLVAVPTGGSGAPGGAHAPNRQLPIGGVK